jgi:hypothetical protein
LPADHVFAYSPNSIPADIPRDYARSPHRVVFHLFGRISGIPDSALIDEETLEFIWKLHEESMSVRLANFFDELRTKRLLLIGNAHPDWLARFFVRLARRDRLYSGNDAREFVADGAVVADAHCTTCFSPQTKSFGVGIPSSSWTAAEKWDVFPKPRRRAENRYSRLPPLSVSSATLAGSQAVERPQATSVARAWMSGLTKDALGPASLVAGHRQNIATATSSSPTSAHATGAKASSSTNGIARWTGFGIIHPPRHRR